MPKQSIFKKFLQSKTFMLTALTVVVLLITAVVAPKAFNVGNAKELLSKIAYGGVFMIGVSCLLISGGIDFSLSASATFGTLLFAQMCLWFPDLHWIVPALCAVVFGAIAGSINAFFANGLNLMPFICTIGMSSVWSGLGTWYTRANVIQIRNTAFNDLSTKYVGQSIWQNSFISYMLVFMIILVILYSIMLKRTRFGRSVLMAGGNPIAARLAGLKPKKIKTILFINAGVLGAIGGLLWASQQKMASPAALITAAPEMTGLTASILGGVAFMGGSGSLSGPFVGVILINVLSYALQSMGLPTWFVTLVNGMLLVIAITIDGYTMKRRMKKLGLSAGGGGGMGMPGMSK